MFIATKDLSYRLTYKLLSGSVVPRPIAWVSSLSPGGVANCAPFSFFTIVSADPPMIGISIGLNDDGERKDTIVNAERTGDFVVNVVVDDMAAHMNLSAVDFPSHISEFTEAGLTPEPSRLVRSPSIRESPIKMECEFDSILSFGKKSAYRQDLLIGRVVAFHIDDGMIDEHYRMDFTRLRPVARLAGPYYGKVQQVYRMKRQDFKQYQSEQ